VTVQPLDSDRTTGELTATISALSGSTAGRDTGVSGAGITGLIGLPAVVVTAPFAARNGR